LEERFIPRRKNNNSDGIRKGHGRKFEIAAPEFALSALKYTPKS
jgi:hypothetical protein